LERRLERLTGEDPKCCTEDLQAIVEAASAAPEFARALLHAKAMADEKRLQTLSLLKRRGELCGCEIQAALGLTHATVSHHMACLETAGLVTPERRGKWTYYRLTKEARALVP
jgi:ArsR family transcriptional regulator